MPRKKALPVPEEKQAVAKYEPTPMEQEAEKAYWSAVDGKLPAPKAKIVPRAGVGKVDIDHDDQSLGFLLLKNSMGTTSSAFAIELFGQLSNAVSLGAEPDVRAINFALSVIDGIKPQDQLEAMLAAQMAVVHMETMRFARKLTHVETLNQQNSNERALNKLMRTFMDQMTALRKHRTGGKQEVTVHHVTVNEGGQAIVGNVQQARGEGEG